MIKDMPHYVAGALMLCGVAACSMITDAPRNAWVEAAETVVNDTLLVTIHNEGADAIRHNYGACTPFLEPRENGEWQGLPTYDGICILVAYVMTIAPGEQHVFGVDVGGLSGEYRVHLRLGDDEGLLPKEMRVSEPFELP